MNAEFHFLLLAASEWAPEGGQETQPQCKALDNYERYITHSLLRDQMKLAHFQGQRRIPTSCIGDNSRRRSSHLNSSSSSNN